MNDDAPGQLRFDIDDLLKGSAFPHSAESLEKMETHISWVLLAGDYAYKIKKPIQFDFVDYSTLELRHHYCQMELELNRRLAPQLYLQVVPIVMGSDGPQFASTNGEAGEAGPDQQPLEYAVQMRRFSQTDILSAKIRSDGIASEAISELGTDIARFHQTIESIPLDHEYANTALIGRDARDNFPTLLDAFQNDPDTLKRLFALKQWTNAEFDRLRPRFHQRLGDGFMRNCHGDMHLNNIVQIADRLVVFDCIEFNEELRWIDTMNEAAFTMMDLVAYEHPHLAYRFLTAYLEQSGDYGGVAVLSFFLVYRALVRAKVMWLSTGKDRIEDVDPKKRDACQVYLQTAHLLAGHPRKSLTITHGFSGSGKSTEAMKWVERHRAIRLRSDVERDRLTAQYPEEPKYSNRMTDLVYTRLRDMAADLLDWGYPVVVDATFLDQSRRHAFADLAHEHQVPFGILDCQADYQELCRRLQRRHEDASEATIEVLNQQMRSHEPLSPRELESIVTV